MLVRQMVRAVSVIPRMDLRREMSMEWFMVSEVALCSRRLRMLSELCQRKAGYIIICKQIEIK